MVLSNEKKRYILVVSSFFAFYACLITISPFLTTLLNKEVECCLRLYRLYRYTDIPWLNTSSHLLDIYAIH